MKAEKKFFSLNGTDYRIVKGKRWYVEFYIQHPMGVRERKREYGQINRIKDLDEREKKAFALIHSLAAGTYAKKRNDEYDWAPEGSVLIEVLKKYRPAYRFKTWHSYKTRLKHFYLWLNGRPDHSVTQEMANDFLLHLLSRRGTETARSYRQTLASLYNKWSDDQINPFKKTIAPPKSGKSLMFFNDWQISRLKKLISKEDPQLWLAVQLLYFCFIRPGEMRLLRTDDINWQYGFIEIRAEVSKNKKTQKVSIPLHLAESLEQSVYLHEKKGFLFSSDHEGMLPVGKNHFNRMHSMYLKRLGITGRYAFYSWKHTGVVKAVKAGINVKDLQLQLRHHSLDMVNEYLKNLGVMDSEELRNLFPAL